MAVPAKTSSTPSPEDRALPPARQLHPASSPSLDASAGALFVAAVAVLVFVGPTAVAPAPPTELPLVVEVSPPKVPAPVLLAETPPSTVPTLLPVVELAPPKLLPVVESAPPVPPAVVLLVPALPPTPAVPPSPPPSVVVVGPVNFHQLNLKSSPSPPVNRRNRSCLPAPPLTGQVTVVQELAPDTSQVPSEVPVSLSRWSSIVAF